MTVIYNIIYTLPHTTADNHDLINNVCRSMLISLTVCDFDLTGVSDLRVATCDYWFALLTRTGSGWSLFCVMDYEDGDHMWCDYGNCKTTKYIIYIYILHDEKKLK